MQIIIDTFRGLAYDGYVIGCDTRTKKGNKEMARYKKATVTENGQLLTWTFANGKVLTCDVATLPTDIMIKAAVHGVRQKGSDCYAGDDSADTAYESCKEVLETLVAGEWTSKREAGEKASSLFDEALERFLATQPEVKVTAIRDGLANGRNVTVTPGKPPVFVDADTFKKKLRDLPAIKALIADIQKERAEKAAQASDAVSVDALIGV